MNRTGRAPHRLVACSCEERHEKAQIEIIFVPIEKASMRIDHVGKTASMDMARACTVCICVHCSYFNVLFHRTYRITYHRNRARSVQQDGKIG